MRVLNDSVVITMGPYAGHGAAVIAVLSTEPVLTYVVELGDDGRDVHVAGDGLRLIEE